MSTQALVSILLPVRNNEHHLVACLESLLSQTYTNIEIIAIDDYSRDNSYAILTSYRKKDKRIKIYRNVKQYGLRLTLNRCVKRSRGEFIAFMNPDDYSSKSRIARQVQFLLQNQKIAAVGTQCYIVNSYDKKLEASRFPSEHETIYNSLLHTDSMQPESIMINKYNVPKDLLQFTSDAYPYIYRRFLLNLVKYGEVANIGTRLYFHRDSNIVKLSMRKYLPIFMKLLVKSHTLYDYRPTFSALFMPLVKGI